MLAFLSMVDFKLYVNAYKYNDKPLEAFLACCILVNRGNLCLYRVGGRTSCPHHPSTLVKTRHLCLWKDLVSTSPKYPDKHGKPMSLPCQWKDLVSTSPNYSSKHGKPVSILCRWKDLMSTSPSSVNMV